MAWHRADHRSFMICGFRVHRGGKGERKVFALQDCRDLILHPHPARRPIALQYVHAPGVADEGFYRGEGDRLTVFQMPSYAPDLNTQEGICALVRGEFGILAATNVEQLAKTVRAGLKI
ncbi:hypothetical protein ACWEQL_08585 [Kitasatospora sp. NPDC004240]